MDSDVQKAWVEMAANIRVRIAGRIEEVAVMTPDDLSTFVEAAQAAYWLELNAHVFDKKVQDEQLKLYCDEGRS